MNELTLALMNADNIITETYRRWESGKRMRTQADNTYSARKRDLNNKNTVTRVITLIVASIAGMFLIIRF